MNTIPDAAATRGLSLKSILPQANSILADDIIIRSCCGSWCECQPGDLYVAVMGAELDGHDFVQEALERGAIAVVTERLLAIDRPQFIVEDTRMALGQICQALAGNPTDLISAIGVSGSDGKTVTAHLIHSILDIAGGSPSLAADGVTPSSHEVGLNATQAHSVSIAQWMASSVMDRASHAILEISPQALATQQLHGTGFDLMVVTNIRRDETGAFGTDDTYQRVQARAVEHLKPQGIMILNADDPNSIRLLDEVQTPALTIGMHAAAEITAKVVGRSANDLTFVLTAGTESAVVNTAMIGNHHVYNCLNAAAVGLALGIELSTVAQGLESLGQVPGRIEPVVCGQDYNLYVDIAQRPTPLATAIHAVRAHSTGKVWVLATVTDQQTPRERSRLGEILEKMADHIIIAPLKNPTVIDYEPYHQILDGFENTAKARIVPNRFRAIELLLSECPPGDSILIAGGGDLAIASIESGKWHITDRDVCQAWLYDQTSFSPITADKNSIYNIDDYRRKQR